MHVASKMSLHPWDEPIGELSGVRALAILDARRPTRVGATLNWLKRSLRMTKRNLTVILLCLALGSPAAFAANDDTASGDKAQQDRDAAARAADAQCASAVSLFYLGNP